MPEPDAGVVDFCKSCGVVHDPGEALRAALERVEALQRQVSLQAEDMGLLERDLRTKRAQIKRMTQERDDRLKKHPRYNDALEVLTYWQAQCHPKAREVTSSKRMEPVIARLTGGYTVDQLKRCAWGYSRRPYNVGGKRQATGPRDCHFTDAELIFRGPKQVDAGLRIADQEEDFREVLSAQPPSIAPTVESKASGQSLGTLGDQALRYVAHGWLVFPVKPMEKAPATRNGFLDATLDPQTIRECWTRFPNMNVGVRTGAESGILVLDVDGEEGYESLRALEGKFGALPETASVVTPRGGQHFYFRHPGVEIRNTAGIPGPGLDIRCDGGYVLAPPSQGPLGTYEVDDQVPIAQMPEWLKAGLIQHQMRATSTGAVSRERAQLIGEGAGEGTRNQRMASHVGWLLRKMDLPETRASAHVWNEARLKPPLSPREVDSIVDSIARKDARR